MREIYIAFNEPKGNYILEVFIMKEWKNKPMTWGGYAKMCGVSALISLPISALSIVMMAYPWKIIAFGDTIKSKFKK